MTLCVPRFTYFPLLPLLIEPIPIFHQSLREYLLDKSHNQDFWCDALEQHDNIINYCQEKSQSWQEIELINSYSLRHLAKHFVFATRTKELHHLLSQDKNKRNAWFNAKESIGDTSGFLTDIALAWQQAESEREFLKEQDVAIGLQCRYALITASIKSLAEKISPELRIAQMIANPTKGLAYTQQIQDTQTLSRIASSFPECAEALLKIADKITEKDYKTRVQSALAKYLPCDLLAETLEAVGKLKQERDQSQSLIDLAPYLSNNPNNLLQQALSFVQVFVDEENQVNALIALIQYLPDNLIPDALSIVLAIKYGDFRANALRQIVPRLPEDLLKEALTAIINIPFDVDASDNEYSLAQELSALAAAPYLPIDVIEKMTVKSDNLGEKRKVFSIHIRSALAAHLPSVLSLKNILEEQEITENEFYLVNHILRDIAKQWSNELFSATRISAKNELFKVLFEKTQNIKDESFQTEALRRLALTLPSEELSKVLEMVWTLKNEKNQNTVLNVLCSRLSQNLLQQILEKVQLFTDKEIKTQVIITLILHLTDYDLLHNICEQANKIDHKYQQAKILSALAIRLPEVLPKAWKASTIIQDKSSQCNAIKALISITNVLEQNEQHQILNLLKSDLSPEEKIQLELCSPEELPKKALDIALKISQNKQHCILIKLIPYLPEKLIETVLDAVWTLDEFFQADVLKSLACRLPEELLCKALENTFLITNEYILTKNLSVLATAHCLSDKCLNMIQKRSELLEKKYQTLILSAIATHLPLEHIEKIMQDNQMIENDRDIQYQVLNNLAPLLPEKLIQKALEQSLALVGSPLGAKALNSLVPRLKQLSDDKLFSLWIEILHKLSNNEREKLFNNFIELFPICFRLSNVEAVVKKEIQQAIEDVCRQWP